MSDHNFQNHLKNTQNRLDQVSSCFCLAKWLQVTIHLQTGFTHSCHNTPYQKVPLEELKYNPTALHNNYEKKVERRSMLNGVRPKGCNYCWRVEDLKTQTFSDRIIKSSDEWSSPYFDEVKNLPWDADIHPRYLEVSFGNLCNLACSYCLPDISSRVYADLEAHGRYPVWDSASLAYLKRKGRVPYKNDEDNPYIPAFWKWFPDVYPGLHDLRVTGGEPLINPNTFRMLDYVKSHPNPKLNLSVNSNFCVPKDRLENYKTEIAYLLDNNCVKDVHTYVSVDTAGAQAEYIRDGLTYSRFLDNIREYHEFDPRFKLTIMVTYNLFSVPNFLSFLKDILKTRHELQEHRQYLDISILRWPNYMSAILLPKSWAEKIEEGLLFMQENTSEKIGKTGFNQYDIHKMQRVLEWFKSFNLDKDELRLKKIDFYRFVNEYDRRRRRDFKVVFPELLEFYMECERLEKSRWGRVKLLPQKIRSLLPL